MAKQNDGGPAFPCPPGYGPHGEALQAPQEGLSLRAWFAGQALPGILAAEATESLYRVQDEVIILPGAVAMLAVACADALLAELQKERG